MDTNNSINKYLQHTVRVLYSIYVKGEKLSFDFFYWGKFYLNALQGGMLGCHERVEGKSPRKFYSNFAMNGQCFGGWPSEEPRN